MLRLLGANRYSNAFVATGGATTNSEINAPSMFPEVSMAPPTFGFIPAAGRIYWFEF